MARLAQRCEQALPSTLPIERARAEREHDLQNARSSTEVVMKRHMAAGLSIFAVVAGVGWKLATQPPTSAGLQDISVIERSEHSHPGPTKALAGLRIRLSPSDFGYEVTATAHEVPQISVAAE
jgi:hypothetical protein